MHTMEGETCMLNFGTSRRLAGDQLIQNSTTLQSRPSYT
uniref:Uncharacterized protein n=1 Tax=Anguilla anguilla TaxID=7936 RepID=A0A0E9R5H4_ANGAN